MFKFLNPLNLCNAYTVFMDAADEGGAGGGGGNTETPEQKTASEAAEADAKKKAAEKIDPLTLDIKTAIEKARKQEKDKLYGEIEERKKAAKTAEDLAAARANEVKTLQQQIAELTAKVKPDGEGDEEKKKSKKAELNEEMLNKAIDAAVSATSKNFEGILSAAQKRIEELEKGNEAKDLNTFREELISKNKDYIVPELVTGTTRDEIEQSLVLAKQVFARVTQGMKKEKGAEGGGNAPETKRTMQLPPVPNVNNQGAPGAPRQVDVTQLSTKDYATNRADLLKAAAAAARESMAAE